jgi:6-methylsalicylic acid synthase
LHSEQPEVFGGLIDTEHVTAAFPLEALKYVRGVDVTRIEDGVARCARLRPLNQKLSNGPFRLPLRLLQHATYLITGGLGTLGIETARWMVERGARNIVLA